MTDGDGRSANDRLAAGTAQIDQITQEVYAVHHYRYLWRRLAEITQAVELPPSAFFDALTRWYSATQSIAVRRQLDTRRDTVSLIRLLEDIARHPTTMTRERHVALWVGENPRPVIDQGDGWTWTPFLDEAHANFDRFSGDRNRDYISRGVVQADIHRLEATAQIVLRFVNEAVAHTALQPERAVMTYNELNGAIDTVAELVNKYTSLLKAETNITFEPAIQHDWEAVFRMPWIR